jgi:hypothetical protein
MPIRLPHSQLSNTVDAVASLSCSASLIQGLRLLNTTLVDASTGGIFSTRISRNGEPVEQTVEVLLTYTAGVRHANDTTGYFQRNLIGMDR